MRRLKVNPNQWRSSAIIEKELIFTLKKAKKLHHIKKLNEIIKDDFSCRAENLFKKNILYVKLCSNNYDINQKFIMYESFKIKPKKDCNFNLLSNKSVNNICLSSKLTLKELTIRGNTKITTKVGDYISTCVLLEKLDLSECK